MKTLDELFEEEEAKRKAEAIAEETKRKPMTLEEYEAKWSHLDNLPEDEEGDGEEDEDEE